MSAGNDATSESRDHPAALLKHPDGTSALIDRTLVPLIQHLWNLGVDTLASCEAYPDQRARILFGSAHALEAAHLALHASAPGHVAAHALMRSAHIDDWAVAARPKLWFPDVTNPYPLADGPTTLYYELSMPAAHAAGLAAALADQ